MGNPIDNSIFVTGIKVMRSGRRNQQSTPIGSLTTLKSPVTSGVLSIDSSKYILNATATEYDNVRKVRCNYYSGNNCENTLSPEMADMISLLQYLIVNHKLNGSVINLNTPEYYPNLYTPVLKEAFNVTTYHNYLKTVNNSGYWEVWIDNNPDFSSLPIMCMRLLNLLPGSPICISGIDLNYNDDNNIRCVQTNTIGLIVDNYGVTYNAGTLYHTIIGATLTLPGCSAVITSPVPNNYITNSLVNPYVTGLLGHWYPQKSYEYLTTRTRHF